MWELGNKTNEHPVVSLLVGSSVILPRVGDTVTDDCGLMKTPYRSVCPEQTIIKQQSDYG